MASGVSKRFGANKLLASFGGRPLFTHIVDATGGQCFSKRLVLTRTAEVAEYCQKHDIDVILHALPDRDQAVRLGIEHMMDMDACMFCPADQPLLQRESIQKLIKECSENGSGIYRISYEKSCGTPILFTADYFEQLTRLPHKKGGGYIAELYPEQVKLVEAFHELELYDIDTPEALEELERRVDTIDCRGIFL